MLFFIKKIKFNKINIKKLFIIATSFAIYFSATPTKFSNFNFTKISKSFAWEIDLSRRQNDFIRREIASDSKPIIKNDKTKLPSNKNLIKKLINNNDIQQIVILNTENGFIPNKIHLKSDNKYKIYLVNINKKEKNISFILEKFKQHHATYFAEQVHFEIKPKEEGIFSFVCPETDAQGKIIVTSNLSIHKDVTKN